MRSFGCIGLLAALAVLAVPASGGADPEELIVVERGGRVVVVRSDGNDPVELGAGFAPALAPDQARIALLDGGDVWVLERASGTRTRITETPAVERAPVWSPDGTRIAFATPPSVGDAAGLDVAAADGSRIVRIASDLRNGQATPPTWSPDGTELAYVAVRGFASDLAVARADGSGTRRLTADDVYDLAPSWEPRGSTIAFLRGSTEGYTLHLIEADGTGLRQVSRTPAWTFLERGPAWSPDARRIVFADSTILFYTRYGPVYSTDLRVVELAGGERPLQAGGERPDWSADGRRILFQTLRQVPSEPGGPQAYVMNADGSCQSRVTAGNLGAQPWRGASGPSLRCADVQISATQDRSVVGIEQAATFVLTVTNIGNEVATGVRLDLDEPTNGVLASAVAAGECSVGLGASCSLGMLPPGGTARVTAVLHARLTGQVRSTARVRSSEPDRNQAGNYATLQFESMPCTHVGTWDSDVLVGTHGNDTICALTGRDVIRSLGGADTIDAGNGGDRVFPGPGRDSIKLKGGDDFVDARDGRRDVIACGGELDIALVDRIDAVADRCEVVSTTRLRCTILGTSRPNAITGSPRRDSICAFSGSDSVDGGAGNDEIDGGTGNDTLTGGPGHDLIVGAGGNDLIRARDGARDRIRCGSELDLVLADRKDLAAADCERVLRR